MERQLIGIVLILTSNLCFGFSGFVHELICDVAYELSEPSTKTFIDKIMKTELSYKSGKFGPSFEYSYTKAKSFGKGCIWADDSRTRTHIETYEMHFINVPKARNIDFERDCAKYNCVNQAIIRYGIELSDKRTYGKNKIEALYFLGHFVGDLHQPLHVGNLEDLGGNRIKPLIEEKGKWGEKSLHSIWDNTLPTRAGLRTERGKKQILDAARKEKKSNIANTSVSKWAVDSFNHARESAYKYKGKEIKDKRKLYKNFFDGNKQLIIDQVVKASVRLAHLLELAAKNKIEPGVLK